MAASTLLFSANRMNPTRQSNPQSAPSVTSQLLETQSAFDSVAADYDGPRQQRINSGNARRDVALVGKNILAGQPAA
jgi:hypothetical protein